ncbi:hypothetical protein [Bacterioplanoides sp.]|uniref:hypothetical protein n=1 Tax=Bacterioplanoides sp. TaxID=2066072 RepID=UPI003B5B76CF
MAKLTDLSPEVVAETPECPIGQVNKALINTIRDFCWNTHYWQHEMEPITLLPFSEQAPETCIYTLPVPENTEMLTVITLVYNGSLLSMKSQSWLDSNVNNWRQASGEPLYYLMMSDKRVRFVPASDIVRPVAVTGTLILQPTKVTNEFDDRLMEFDQAIINGALAKLLVIPDKKWSNSRRATVSEAVYQEGLSRARFMVIKGFSTGTETAGRRSWL